MPPVNQKQVKYNYLPLNSLQSNTKVNVYGVVKFVKQPYKSRGSDYCMMLSIVDQSQTTQDEKLKCLLFAKEESKLPPAQVGDVIRFHRLTISKFAGDLQGQSSPGFSWVLFSGDPGGTLEPKAFSSQSFTLPDEEKQTIEDLRSWASGHGLTKTYSKFKNIAAGCYFDAICQVISTCVIEEDVCLLLQVWDGTQTIYNVRQIDTSNAENQMILDSALLSKAEGFIYDLCLFDDHLKVGSKIKPGDFIEICNLHAAVFKTPVVRPLETVELVLHRGTSFGRGVRILAADASIAELKKLREDLEKICIHSQTDSQDSLSDSVLLRADDNVNNKTEREKIQKGGNIDKDNKTDAERPSTSRDGIVQNEETAGNSIESVQIIESVGTGDRPSANKERFQTDNQTESGSGESVQIIESVQSETKQSKAKESVQKENQTDSESGESVQIIESVQNEGTPSIPNSAHMQKQTDSGSGKSVHIVESSGTKARVSAAKLTSLKRKQDVENSNENVKAIKYVQTEDHASASTTDTDSSKRHRQELNIAFAQNTDTVEADSSSERQSGSLQRCVLKTATNHLHVKKTSIADVLKHEIPYKFKVRARVYDYHPKPDSVEQFLQLYCRVCNYLCPVPGLDSTNNNNETESQLQIGSTFKGVPHYNCPKCFAQKDSLQDLDSPPHLSYIYMLRLLLRDDSGWLLANIWKSDAETFLRDVTPEELFKKKTQLKLIQDCLHQICPANVDYEDKPWIECCIRSYSTQEGTGYQIFDTVVA